MTLSNKIRGWNVAVPAFVQVFSTAISPRDLYYWGRNNKKITLDAQTVGHRTAIQIGFSTR